MYWGQLKFLMGSFSFSGNCSRAAEHRFAEWLAFVGRPIYGAYDRKKETHYSLRCRLGFDPGSSRHTERAASRWSENAKLVSNAQ
jgi:hypothetical protein